jgi:hypothetical protein
VWRGAWPDLIVGMGIAALNGRHPASDVTSSPASMASTTRHLAGSASPQVSIIARRLPSSFRSSSIRPLLAFRLALGLWILVLLLFFPVVARAFSG